MTTSPGWKIKPLSDVVSIQRGFDLPHHARRPGPFPVLTSGETGGFHDEGPVKGPGVTIGRATNLGQPKWSEGDFWPHNTTMFVKDFKGNLPRWVFHLFENTDLTGFDSGSVQPMLNRNYIAQVPVLVPPLKDQEAIAEVLGALDGKMAANTKLSGTASELMVRLLTTYPVGLPLSDLVVHRRETTNPENVPDDSVAHFSLPAFDTDQCPEMCTPASIKSSKFVVAKPSVLISKLNPRFPRIWDVATLPGIPALASTEFLVLEPKEDFTAVIWAVLSQPSFSATLQSQVSGTSSSHQRVKPTDLLATPVTDLSLVPTAVKCQIAALGSRVEATRIENRTLAATRDALLPQLMSGKLRVKDAEKVLEEAGI